MINCAKILNKILSDNNFCSEFYIQRPTDNRRKAKNYNMSS